MLVNQEQHHFPIVGGHLNARHCAHRQPRRGSHMAFPGSAFPGVVKEQREGENSGFLDLVQQVAETPQRRRVSRCEVPTVPGA